MGTIIKLTSATNNEPIYLNSDLVGHFYEYKATLNNGTALSHTVVGCMSHSNGGFKVTESAEEVQMILEKAKG